MRNILSIKIGFKKNSSQPLLLIWMPIVIALMVLYIPSLYDLLTGIWATDEQMHGPIVLCISLWLLYNKWPAMLAASQEQATSLWGWPIIIFGLLLYTLGRPLDILIFEIGSIIFIICGLILINLGKSALKTQWFSIFFMFFMIPLPGPLVDIVTMPMKMAVSFSTEQILYALDYPIGRNGVILQIGQYSLLVADACAGLHTLLTLEALGLLYLSLVKRDSFFRNISLAFFIIPISFTANVIRVITLSLITFHFGEAAGQGFLHGFAGMVLFISALLLIIMFDTVIQSIEAYIKRRKILHE